MELAEIHKLYEENRVLKTVTIELVNQCNWKCKHCYLDRDVSTLDISKVFEIIDDARDLGAFEVRLSGGEVMLCPQLADIIIYARKKYMNVILLTNLSKLPINVYNCIAEFGIERVEVTLFSLVDEVHDNFVGSSGSLKRVLKNIEILNRLGIDILVKTWAVRSNYNELETMADYFKKKGYRFSINVQIYSDIHGEMKLPEEEKLTVAEYCHALYLHDKTVNRQLPLANEDSNPLCVEFLTSIYITAYGEVVPCAKYRKCMWNIFEHSLKEMWVTSVDLQEVQNYCWRDCVECLGCKKKAFCVRCGAMSHIKGFMYMENCSATCLLAEIRMSNYQVGGIKNVY